MKLKTWTIKTESAGERLDHFLVSQWPNLSRSAIQKMIKDGQVLVNGKKVTVHRFLKEGDRIEARRLVESGLLDSPSKRLRVTNDELRITPKTIAETSDWLVIDKPAGLLVHPDSKTQRGTLIDWLLAHDPKIGRVGENPDRPGIIHRLDREVSGLMVIAKTQTAYDDLQRQFRERVTKKIYLALVHGEFSKDEGDIKFRIARSTTQARMAARPEKEEGKAAWTHYQVKQRFRGATLLELEILSGRTHQIRAHLHALGHPVIGDTLYALRRTDRKVLAPRLMLQSTELTFKDPKTGTEKTFSLHPDPAFKQLLSSFT